MPTSSYKTLRRFCTYGGPRNSSQSKALSARQRSLNSSNSHKTELDFGQDSKTFKLLRPPQLPVELISHIIFILVSEFHAWLGDNNTLKTLVAFMPLSVVSKAVRHIFLRQCFQEVAVLDNAQWIFLIKVLNQSNIHSGSLESLCWIRFAPCS